MCTQNKLYLLSFATQLMCCIDTKVHLKCICQQKTTKHTPISISSLVEVNDLIHFNSYFIAILHIFGYTQTSISFFSETQEYRRIFRSWNFLSNDYKRCVYSILSLCPLSYNVSFVIYDTFSKIVTLSTRCCSLVIEIMNFRNMSEFYLIVKIHVLK